MAEVETAVLQGPRVRLTPLQIENIHTHFKWNNDPELNRLDSELPFVREGFGAFKDRFEGMVSDPSPLARDFEVHAEDGTLLGIAYISQISPHNRHCTLGLTIGERERWGKLYGRESLEVLLEYCFDTLGLHRVSSETFEYNAAWQKLVVEAGFRKDGSERDYLYRDDRFWDKEVYSLLETEYRLREDSYSRQFAESRKEKLEEVAG